VHAWCRGRGKEREFTSLIGNRQFKIVIKRVKEYNKSIKSKSCVTVQITQNKVPILIGDN